MNTIDPHRARAAEMFGVPEEQVTKEQRQLAKLDNYRLAYGVHTPPVRDKAGKTPRVLLREADGGWELYDQYARRRITWWRAKPSAYDMRTALRGFR